MTTFALTKRASAFLRQLRTRPRQFSSASAQPEWMVNLRNEDWLTGEREPTWYTGKHPNDCPGMMADGTLTSLEMPRLDNVTRSATQDYFDNTWTLYEMLFAGLNSEEYFYRPPPHGLRHPQIFYYGHTPCLYVNKLLVSGVLKEGVNPYFESIFEIGVDEMTWDDMGKNDMVWPTVAETHEYRQQVYKTVSSVIQEQLSDTTPQTITWDDPLWSLFMGFEHDRIHLETSSVLVRVARSFSCCCRIAAGCDVAVCRSSYTNRSLFSFFLFSLSPFPLSLPFFFRSSFARHHCIWYKNLRDGEIRQH